MILHILRGTGLHSAIRFRLLVEFSRNYFMKEFCHVGYVVDLRPANSQLHFKFGERRRIDHVITLPAYTL